MKYYRLAAVGGKSSTWDWWARAQACGCLFVRSSGIPNVGYWRMCPPCNHEDGTPFAQTCHWGGAHGTFELVWEDDP